MQIQYTKEAIKQINSLDVPTKKRIKAGIDGLPFGDIKKLKGYSNKYRLRIGGYRIIFDMAEETIIINAVPPRGSAYKNL